MLILKTKEVIFIFRYSFRLESIAKSLEIPSSELLRFVMNAGVPPSSPENKHAVWLYSDALAIIIAFRREQMYGDGVWVLKNLHRRLYALRHALLASDYVVSFAGNRITLTPADFVRKADPDTDHIHVWPILNQIHENWSELAQFIAEEEARQHELATRRTIAAAQN